MFIGSKQLKKFRKGMVMDCEKTPGCKPVGCGGCGGPSVIKVGRWWHKIRYMPREGNEEFIAAMDSITKSVTPEKAKEMGQEGLDALMKSLPSPKVVDVDFLDQNPAPTRTHDGKILFWKGGEQYEISDFVNAEVIQVALCTDPKCVDPECLKYQAEIREKEKSGFLKIVK